MKKLILTTSISLIAIFHSSGQVHLDVKVGISPSSNPKSASIFVNRTNPYEEFLFNMIHVKSQFYGGVGLHIGMKEPFFLESGVYYSRKSSMYEVCYEMLKDDRSPIQHMTETESLLHLPVSIGVRVGPVDISSGVSLSKNMAAIKQLSHLDGFEHVANPWRAGWQMGVRYPIQRLMVGMEFQGSLNRVGEGMKVNDDSLELQNVPGKLVFSIQYRI